MILLDTGGHLGQQSSGYEIYYFLTVVIKVRITLIYLKSSRCRQGLPGNQPVDLMYGDPDQPPAEWRGPDQALFDPTTDGPFVDAKRRCQSGNRDKPGEGRSRQLLGSRSRRRVGPKEVGRQASLWGGWPEWLSRLDER